MMRRSPSSTFAEYLAAIHGRLRPRYRPEDVYLGNLLGRLEALNPGVTTMLDWFYCAQSPEHADASPGAAEYLSHELIVRLQARPPSRLPCLVLGDGSVDLGFLDLLGGCAVPQGLEGVVLVHRNHDSGFATETDDVVTVVLRRLHARASHNPPVVGSSPTRPTACAGYSPAGRPTVTRYSTRCAIPGRRRPHVPGRAT
jgi:hypothetical protein